MPSRSSKPSSKVATISFPAFSGGMGKTTMVYLFAKYLAQKGFNVLTVDCDPQSNLTLYLDVVLDAQDPSMLEFLKGEITLGKKLNPLDAVYQTTLDNLLLIPTDKGLIRAQPYLAGSSNPAVVLKKRLQDLFTESIQEDNFHYDFCIIDSPPEGFHLSMTAIGAADFVVIPALARSKGSQSVSITLDTIQEMIDFDAFSGEILGIAPFQDRWVGQAQTHKSKEFFQSLPAIAQDIPVFPSLRYSEQIPKLIDAGKSLLDLPPPVDQENLVKYHPIYLFDAIFTSIQQKCQSNFNLNLKPTLRTA